MRSQSQRQARLESKEPLRRCIATGAVRPKDELVRFVVSPDGEVVFDPDERLPGRGIWLSADRDALKKACSGRLFAKAARAAVQVPVDLVGHVELGLVRRCLSLIGLARRAGQAVVGYEKARGWLKARQVGLVLLAADGPRASRVKSEAMASGIPITAALKGRELGAASGRERAVHIVVAPGRLAQQLGREAARLLEVRSGPVAGVEP